MDFHLERDERTGNIRFHGELTQRELASLRLDPLDRAVIEDVGGDAKATVADYLLALEIIYRRHAEQQDEVAKEPGNG